MDVLTSYRSTWTDASHAMQGRHSEFEMEDFCGEVHCYNIARDRAVRREYEVRLIRLCTLFL
ncbi:hypothetical protein AC578_5792 [Pseudocercospora eumusae]|uniref:Uncharacterized protein n=1 Tax=Pseudocercospora eumusae TaxID=321146 RepID=A0A139HCD9_9PEZI|nr:hypothetical protein AC578_5792 [Pseudocercospora eumusae]